MGEASSEIPEWIWVTGCNVHAFLGGGTDCRLDAAFSQKGLSPDFENSITKE
jgi:hypothetical protein